MHLQKTYQEPDCQDKFASLYGGISLHELGNTHEAADDAAAPVRH
ncbi:hypothetical protein OKW37_005239 [Paraburkholderia sp. MM5482-R2]